MVGVVSAKDPSVQFQESFHLLLGIHPCINPDVVFRFYVVRNYQTVVVVNLNVVYCVGVFPSLCCLQLTC